MGAHKHNPTAIAAAEGTLPKERPIHLFIGTPMFGGMCHGSYTWGCIQLQRECTKHGIPLEFSFLYNESLVQRGRNTIVRKFLQSEASHLIFIDADIGFDGVDVCKLVATGLDIVGGCYARKRINWNNVKQGLLAFPNLTEEQMGLFAGDFVFGLLPENQSFDVTKPAEVEKVGTGFLCIKREVIENYIKAHPEIMYYDTGTGEGGGAETYAVFDCGINEKGEYLSEDYWFCIQARKLGYKIHILPFIELNHNGSYCFQGSMQAVAAGMGELQKKYEAKATQ